MLTWLPPGVELMTDVSHADWVLERLRPWAEDGARLESFAPEGFDAYARIFHPAGFRPGHRGALDPASVMRWADLARARGIEQVPDIAFIEVSGIDPEDRQRQNELAPMDGELAPETCDALSDLLRAHTRTPGLCWFCLWEGNGAFWSESHGPLRAPGEPPDEADVEAARAQDELLGSTPRVEAYARRYFLFRGPLEAACSFEPSGAYTSPNLWWPDDRAWIVVTEVDGFSTYVSCDRVALADLLASSDVEAIEVTLDTHMDPEENHPWWR